MSGVFKFKNVIDKEWSIGATKDSMGWQYVVNSKGEYESSIQIRNVQIRDATEDELQAYFKIVLDNFNVNMQTVLLIYPDELDKTDYGVINNVFSKCTIFDPKTGVLSSIMDKMEVESFWDILLDFCDCCIIRALPDGTIPMSMALILQIIANRHVPTLEIPTNINPRIIGN